MVGVEVFAQCRCLRKNGKKKDMYGGPDYCYQQVLWVSLFVLRTLQLRVIDGVAAAQLISYSRQDQAGPKKSDFSIATTEVCNHMFYR